MSDPEGSARESMPDPEGSDRQQHPLAELTVEEQVRAERDAQVLLLLSAGIRVPAVAAQFGIAEKTVKRIAEKHEAERPPLSAIDGTKIVHDTIDAYQTAIHDLALIAANSDHNATKVGAIRTKLEVHKGVIELLQAVGAMPEDLAQIAVLEDAREVGRVVTRVFKAFGVQQEAIDTVVAVLEGQEVELPGEEEVEGTATELPEEATV